MKTKIIQNIKSIILALMLVAGVSYVSAVGTWSGPTATAPGNNTDTPLNVGSTLQSKSGWLGVGGIFTPSVSMDIRNTGGLLGGLTTTGGAVLNTGGATNGLIVQNGKVGIGTATPNSALAFGNTLNPLNIASGAARTDSKILLYDLGASNWAGIGADQAGALWLRNGTSASNYLVMLPSNGNVGIGTTNPVARLDVNGEINAYMKIIFVGLQKTPNPVSDYVFSFNVPAQYTIAMAQKIAARFCSQAFPVYGDDICWFGIGCAGPNHYSDIGAFKINKNYQANFPTGSWKESDNITTPTYIFKDENNVTTTNKCNWN
ncbi:MAG: hypothetical protein WC671_01455 [Candidatus Paceibacterota bacterium]